MVTNGPSAAAQCTLTGVIPIKAAKTWYNLVKSGTIIFIIRDFNGMISNQILSNSRLLHLLHSCALAKGLSNLYLRFFFISRFGFRVPIFFLAILLTFGALFCFTVFFPIPEKKRVNWSLESGLRTVQVPSFMKCPGNSSFHFT